MIRVILDDFYDAPFNMAVDEVLFREFSSSDYSAIIRFYGFSQKALTVGVCQKVKTDESLLSFFNAGGEATRRITGGGAVFHDDDLTYSFVTRLEGAFQSLEDSYYEIHACIVNALKATGVESYLSSEKNDIFMGTKKCFVVPVENDVMIGESKIAGAAQKRSKGVLLHQGSIDLNAVKSEIGRDISREDLTDALTQEFRILLGEDAELKAVSDDETNKANDISFSKYKNKEWFLRH